ncbi:phosphatase PAP2 family protein [Parabacteroides sp. Marseille-P3160]|uniref:phosphatase PAP2 family protein n=1 Tax=Parabacteroides sp. Marseille-P3160 TaxID=1917887 RepID=UPI0009B9D6C4|nr:phosphatase PAP2 family protein [Parabacteroides sp. Marseille-P3160]
MLEKILPYEENLFFLINGSHSCFFDCAMWLFSGAIVWIPIVIFLIVNLFYKKSWREWLPVLIAITLMFVLCDQFSSAVCKPYFSRFRPTHYPGIEEHVRTLYGYVGGKYGFISGHATNSFGFATLTALLLRKKLYNYTIFLWALVVSYSRIYLGVHFVSDIVAGAISGITIGFVVYCLYCLCIINKKKKGDTGKPTSLFRGNFSRCLRCFF